MNIGQREEGKDEGHTCTTIWIQRLPRFHNLGTLVVKESLWGRDINSVSVSHSDSCHVTLTLFNVIWCTKYHFMYSMPLNLIWLLQYLIVNLARVKMHLHICVASVTGWTQERVAGNIYSIYQYCSADWRELSIWGDLKINGVALWHRISRQSTYPHQIYLFHITSALKHAANSSNFQLLSSYWHSRLGL